MRASREIRRWIDSLRRLEARHGRRNGGVSTALLDNLEMERKAANAARQRKRVKRASEEEVMA